MAIDLTADEIRELLSGPQPLSSVAFDLVRAICHMLNQNPDAALPQELVLRALARKDELGGCSHLLSALVRQLGLFPYLDEENLGLKDVIALELHRPDGLNDVVLHKVQAQVYRELMNGQNVILSAPTSFGKSLVIDAVIASGRHKNIALVVPTIALVDETRRRLMQRFRDQYRLITHASQSRSDRNIFLLTQERASGFAVEGLATLVVIDEFYKLAISKGDRERSITLNSVFYSMVSGGAQFYLLGPNIQSIPTDLPPKFECKFIKTDYATVATEIHRVEGHGSDEERLVDLCKRFVRDREPSIIYCASPTSVCKVARLLISKNVVPEKPSLTDAAAWTRAEYHPDWLFPNALSSGIGIHHGRLPRSLSQYVVRKFNSGDLTLLVCTSTLIEGVNTRAKNVVIYDNKIAKSKLDYFTFSNIKGRSGRMFHHFVGHVYLFHDPPHPDLPLVDLPVVTQGPEVPDALLLQIATDDLTKEAEERLRPLHNQKILPVDILRAHRGFDPTAQLDIAQEITSNLSHYEAMLSWTRLPNYEQLKGVCNLIFSHAWKDLGRNSGVQSGNQLAFKLWQLQRHPRVRELISAVIDGDTRSIEADAAVEDTLAFMRNWAGFRFPQGLRMLNDIQKHVLGRRKRRFGNFLYYAGQVENLFTEASWVALEEYGIPLQISQKIANDIGRGDLDSVLARVKAMSVDKTSLSRFEQELLADAREAL